MHYIKHIHLLVALVLVGCAALPAPQQIVVPSTIPIITFASPASNELLYEPLIERFNAQNPDMRVQFVALEDLGQDIWQHDGSSVRPYVVAADTSAAVVTPSDVEKKYVRDLKPLIDADAAFDLSDYYPEALQPISSDGGMYVLPQSVYTQVLYYNAALWRAAGLAEPNPLISWQDLLTAAQALAKKEGDKIQVYGLMDGTEGILPFLHLLDQVNINLLGTPVESVEFRQQPIVDALDQTRRMIEAGTLYTLSTSDSTEAVKLNVLDVQRLALDQRLAIWRADAFAPPEDDPRLNFEVGKLIVPATVQPSAPSAQFGYIMSQATQHPSQAWRWLSFLSGQPLMEHTSRFEVPARKSVAEQLRFWQRLPADTAAAMQAYMQQPLPAEQSLGDIATYLALNGVWSDLTAGRVAPVNLVSLAQSRLDEQIASAKQPAAPPLAVTPPEVIPPNVTLITFGVSSPVDGDIHAVAQTFMAEHPDIRVRLRRLDEDTSPQALQRAVAQLDCFGWEKPVSSATVTATLDLKPFINSDRFDLADYPPAALARFRRGDALHGLPYSLQLRVLGYNEALFKTRGVNPPTANWTLDQFLNAAQQVTQREQGGGYYGYGQTSAALEDIPFFLNQFEASITQQTPQGLQPNFLDANVIAALRFYTNLLADYSVNQRLSGFRQGEGTGDLLSNGQIGMWLTRSADGFATSLDQTNPLFEPRVTFPPLAHPERALGDMGVSSLFISASSPHAAACWQWLKFFSEQGALVHPSHFPARISVAESQAYLSRSLPGAAEVYRQYQPLLRETSWTPGEELWDDPQFDPFWLYQAIDRAIQGQPLERELQQAQDTTERYLICVRSGSAANECALRIDPDYKGIGPAQ